MRRVVFLRCAWMRSYAGDDDDPMIGGGSYITHSPGHERFNFKIVKGSVYGRFQSYSATGGFTLHRVEPEVEDEAETLDDVLVVYVATHPTEGGQRVVGWHGGATLHAQENVAKPWQQRDDCGWQVEAPAERAVLLPLAARVWEVPTGEGGMGTTHVRYPFRDDGTRDPLASWMETILDEIDGYDGPNDRGAERIEEEVVDAIAAVLRRRGGQGFLPDAEARRVVEELAMAAAAAHFRERYTTVEDHHVGNPYDLYATKKGKKDLYIEVKGTTGEGWQILVTPGEVEWAKEHRTALFILAGVELEKVDGKWRASGGSAIVRNPWKPTDDELQVTGYIWRRPM
jgi:hypothetical protein